MRQLVRLLQALCLGRIQRRVDSAYIPVAAQQRVHTTVLHSHSGRSPQRRGRSSAVAPRQAASTQENAAEIASHLDDHSLQLRPSNGPQNGLPCSAARLPVVGAPELVLCNHVGPAVVAGGGVSAAVNKGQSVCNCAAIATKRLLLSTTSPVPLPASVKKPSSAVAAAGCSRARVDAAAHCCRRSCSLAARGSPSAQVRITCTESHLKGQGGVRLRGRRHTRSMPRQQNEPVRQAAAAPRGSRREARTSAVTCLPVLSSRWVPIDSPKYQNNAWAGACPTPHPRQRSTRLASCAPLPGRPAPSRRSHWAPVGGPRAGLCCVCPARVRRLWPAPMAAPPTPLTRA